MSPETFDHQDIVRKNNSLPFSLKEIQELAKKHPTPFYIYDERGISDNFKRLKEAFSWNPGFKEYFAVKALPNPNILKMLHKLGAGADCSSMAELVLAEKVAMKGDEIMFTSNNTAASEFKKASELGAIINFDDITHIDFYEKHVGNMPEIACIRYNPGPLREGNAIIGKPEEAKYGFTREQTIQGYQTLRDKGVKKFGLHTMIASNELTSDYFIETAKMLFELVIEIQNKVGIEFDFVNIGGGIGIPYKPNQLQVGLEYVSQGIKETYATMIEGKIKKPLDIRMEMGRMITGPYGYLITQATHKKETYKTFQGVDACMANLMRPGMYDAYHHITVLGKEDESHTQTMNITGSLCENNDQFAMDRQLPEINSGDFLVIHDAGAHGHAMGFQYNGKLRCAELLKREDGTYTLIRRAETLQDLFSTIVFDAIK